MNFSDKIKQKLSQLLEFTIDKDGNPVHPTDPPKKQHQTLSDFPYVHHAMGVYASNGGSGFRPGIQNQKNWCANDMILPHEEAKLRTADNWLEKHLGGDLNKHTKFHEDEIDLLNDGHSSQMPTHVTDAIDHTYNNIIQIKSRSNSKQSSKV